MGGAEQMLLKLTAHMERKRFHSVVVSMTDVGPVGEKLLEQGIPVYTLGMRLGRPNPFGLVKLLRLLKSENPDLIQTWLYHADLLGFIAGKMTGIKRIVWGLRCSNMELKNYRLLTSLTIKVCRWLSFFVDAIVVNSREGALFHKQLGYSKKKMILIPNGFDLGHFKPDEEARHWLRHELSLPSEAILIGLIARLDPMKDQVNFLEAASLVFCPEGKVFFIMVGKGIDAANQDLLAVIPEKIKKYVYLLGLRHDIPRITAGLDIAISSSAYGEGFPNTIGEAMACGIPCVATDVGDSSFILGPTGIIVPPRDAAALAAGLRTLLALGKTGRQRLGKQAGIRVRQRYELGRIVNQFENFYRQIISDSR